MTGFDHKVLHLQSFSKSAAFIAVQVDFTGTAGMLPVGSPAPWATLTTIDLQPNGYQYYVRIPLPDSML
jgi:hypothetical protein